jgi:myo-inositol-1(or 4)-monophosphatase
VISGLARTIGDELGQSAASHSARTWLLDPLCGSLKPRVVTSSLALTWVATGQRAAYVTDGDVRDSVDFTAGIAICEAAGCRCSNLWDGLWDEAAGGLIAAADQQTHAALVGLVERGRG